MPDEHALEKATRVNLLFDFYGPLLTEKQQTFLQYYFHDDYSLGEIAELFGISRQAVYEHIKRAEAVLDAYEDKLKLAEKHRDRMLAAEQIEAALGGLPNEQAKPIRQALERIRGID